MCVCVCTPVAINITSRSVSSHEAHPLWFLPHRLLLCLYCVLFRYDAGRLVERAWYVSPAHPHGDPRFEWQRCDVPVCCTGGGGWMWQWLIPLQPSQPCNSENSLVCYSRLRLWRCTGDEVRQCFCSHSELQTGRKRGTESAATVEEVKKLCNFQKPL